MIWPDFSPEPTAAGSSVRCYAGRFVAFRFRRGSASGGLGSSRRSLCMRARGAKLRSRRDDLRIAQQARNERRPGLRTQNEFLFFPSGLARWRRAKPEGKKRLGVGWRVPGRRPACALLRRALPWAGMILRFQRGRWSLLTSAGMWTRGAPR